jgi:mRNA-degrading endonuclease RelE of RelBE toxin-antitoxin system
MSYKIFSSHKFDKDLKRLSKKFPSLKKEYAELLELIKANPQEGTSIGHNCYKIRLAIASKGKGKSGGARVITYVYVKGETVYLLTIYDKSEQSDITDKELQSLLQLI